jgi:hypothetical protein
VDRSDHRRDHQATWWQSKLNDHLAIYRATDLIERQFEPPLRATRVRTTRKAKAA